jgi:hypothetical protein
MYTMEQRGNDPVFLMGDLFADELKTLVLEFSIPALQHLGEIEVATIRFEYDEINNEVVTHQILELPIHLNAVASEDFSNAKPNEEVVKQVLLLDAAHARKEAMKHADKGDFPTATNILNQAAQNIADSGVFDEQLTQEHNQLREEAVSMDLGSDHYDTRSRKTMASTISYTTTRIWTEGKIATQDRLRRSRIAVERNQPTPKLLLWNNNQLDLVVDKITIGRHSGNDIALPDEDVSESHCQMVRVGDDYYLEDLDSTNGTFANGGQVRGRFRLSVGDVFTVGSWMFMAR